LSLLSIVKYRVKNIGSHEKQKVANKLTNDAKTPPPSKNDMNFLKMVVHSFRELFLELIKL